MRRYIKTTFITSLLLVIIAVLYFWYFKTADINQNPDMLFSPALSREDTEIPPFIITALQINDGKRQLTQCTSQNCRTLPYIASEETPAVTDGQSWYRYIIKQDNKTGRETLVLERHWPASNSSQTIVEETALTRPRDLIISPDGQKVAYWLDNVHEPKKKLTEPWVYSSKSSSTQILAEKLYQPDILTKARWNTSSTKLWFVGETIDEEKEKMALHVISLQAPHVNIRFPNIDWEKHLNIADHGIMDINSTANSLAFVTKKLLNKSKLTIINNDTQTAATVRGTIPYVQWMEDDNLLYAAQDSRGATFWTVRDTIHRHIARHTGTILSIHGNSTGQYVALISKPRRNSKVPASLHILDAKSGYIKEQKSLPRYGQETHLVHIRQNAAAKTVAGAISKLEDSELVAFIEQHLSDITNQQSISAQRILITNKANTLYVDYTNNDNSLQRILLTINDAVRPEWSVSARFKEQSGEWIKTQGGGPQDPLPARLYEWEYSIKQWILKQEL